MYFLLTFVYWVALPVVILTVCNVIFTPSHFHLWAVPFVIAGIFWALFSTSYLVIVGNGVPFYGKHAPKILVRCGPYSMSRHPIYFAYFVYTFGLALIFNIYAVMAVFVELVVFFFLIRVEEKELHFRFKEFETYRKETPLFFPISKWKIDEAKDPPFLFVLLYMIGKFIIKFFYDVRAVGKNNIPPPPYLMVSNHNSYFDPFFIMDAVNVYMKAPLSWAHYDRMKWLIDHVGMFPIKRYTADSSAILKMVRALRHSGMIAIFIESERSWDGRPLSVKNGIERLVKTLKVPILPVRIERAHLMWPRWSPKFRKGRVKVVVGKAVAYENYQQAFDFVLRDTVAHNERYKDYRGIETYIWKCPKCGTVSALKSHRQGFFCTACGSKWKRPSVEEVRNMHDMNYPSDVKELPLEDMAEVNGKEKRVILNSEGIRIGKFIPLADVKAFVVESHRELYLYNGELYEIRPRNTSVLMWKEWMDFLKKDDENYWAYRK